MKSFFHKTIVFSTQIGIILFASLLVLTLVPGASSLWYENVNTHITVKTGEWSHPRSKGYWCNQLAGALCGCHRHNGNSLSLSVLAGYLRTIDNKSTVFTFNGTDRQNIITAMSQLGCCHNGCMWSHNSMEYKLKAQLLAVWLNTVSGYGEGYYVDLGNTTKLTGWDIINLAETALTTNNVGSYESLKDLCETYNTQWD